MRLAGKSDFDMTLNFYSVNQSQLSMAANSDRWL